MDEKAKREFYNFLKVRSEARHLYSTIAYAGRQATFIQKRMGAGI